MSGTIYKIFLFKPSTYGLSLSQEEQNKMLQKATELREQAGAKMIVTACCYWSNEAWQYFGIEEFPSIEAIQKHSMAQMGLNWARGIDAQTFLGVASNPVTPFTEKSGFLKLYFAEFTEQGYSADPQAVTEMTEKHNRFQKDNQVREVLSGNLISSERYTTFGLEHFPSLDAYISYQRCLEDIQWARYIKGNIFLGTAV